MWYSSVERDRDRDRELEGDNTEVEINQTSNNKSLFQ